MAMYCPACGAPHLRDTERCPVCGCAWRERIAPLPFPGSCRRLLEEIALIREALDRIALPAVLHDRMDDR